MDESPSDAAIAVHEGVDGLELGVCDSRLSDGGKVIVVGEGTEVSHEFRDELAGRRHIHRRAGIEARPTDPVLLATQLPGVRFQARASQ